MTASSDEPEVPRESDEDATRPTARAAGDVEPTRIVTAADSEATLVVQTPQAGAAPTEHFGPYRVVEELGRGGQGVVYLAEDTRLHRKVALKVLTHVGPGFERGLLRFQREAEVAARLDEPALCPVYETGVENGLPFIAMRYVEGESLAARIRRERTERESAGVDAGAERSARARSAVASTVTIVEECARALHQAHEAGIVHRDVKPANIMLDAQERPVILDFGLAGAEDDDLVTITGSHDVFGTPAYMSPEQFRRGASPLDRRTDVWALGVTLYECLTHRRPFGAPTWEGLAREVEVSEPERVRRLEPTIPRDLETVVRVALEKSRERRYQTALDLAEDLRRVRAREPILARPSGTWTRLGRWAERNPALAVSLVALFATLAVGLVASLILLRQARDAEERAVREKIAREVALGEKTKLLERYEQLADVRRVRILIDEAEAHWPRRPDRVPAMDSWLGAAAEVMARREAHVVELARLRALALPQDDADRARDAEERDLRNVELLKTIAALRAEIAVRDEQLREPDVTAESRAALMADRAALVEALGASEADPRLTARLSWRFASDADAWRHGVLGRVVEELATLAVRVADVAARRRFALAVVTETVTDAAELWAACADDLADDERFDDLELEPQVGLIPLGVDRASGFWEFWHPGSGAAPRWEGERLAGAVVVTPESGFVLVLLPGGSFRIGAQSADPDGPHYHPRAESAEGPPHDVALAPFFMGKHEVTQAQWKRLTGTTPSLQAAGAVRGDRMVTTLNPVERVSWIDADRWLRRLELELPTEAQWERAARAGSHGAYWWGDDVAGLAGRANLADEHAHRFAPNWAWIPGLDDGYVVHAPIGTFAPNPLGLHDMIGNVFEWCRDRSADYAVPARPGDGLRDATTTIRAIRGGASSNEAAVGRASFRNGLLPDTESDVVGLRVSRPVR